jgi:hypothetical protein
VGPELGVVVVGRGFEESLAPPAKNAAQTPIPTNIAVANPTPPKRSWRWRGGMAAKVACQRAYNPGLTERLLPSRPAEPRPAEPRPAVE